MKRRALQMPSMHTAMLCVCGSLARKSSASVRPMLACGPNETTLEKPTPLPLAQSSVAAVSAPDWLTKAIVPSRASVPAVLALSCSEGRWMPSEFGPSRWIPSRRAMRCNCAACCASMPLLTMSAARQCRWPATSSAAACSAGGSAITARSARVCFRSCSVPLVFCRSRKASVPL